ncbi:Protein MNN4 [Nakaseomyces bracarensis]|uniref:Protein MNN4 n=1 Tax=Nakaseomyces bracarensis TaxID=273131 RepID=A0ABR4NSD5_9SACH
MTEKHSLIIPRSVVRVVITLITTGLLVSVILLTTSNKHDNKVLEMTNEWLVPASASIYSKLGSFVGYDSRKTDLVEELKENPGALELAKKIYHRYKFDSSPEWVTKYTLKKNLLRYSAGPRKGENIPSLDKIGFYDFDPRLTWSVYLHHLLNTTSPEYEDDETSIMSFSWYDWSDFHEVNNVLAASVSSLPCNFVLESAFDREYINMIEAENGEPLFNYERNKYFQESWYKQERKLSDFHKKNKITDFCEPFNVSKHYALELTNTPKHLLNSSLFTQMHPPFYVKQPHDVLRPEVYQLQARIFMWSTLPSPTSLTILDGIEGSYQIPINTTNRLNLAQSGLLQSFVNNKTQEAKDRAQKAKWTEPETQDIDIEFNHVDLFEDFLKSDKLKKFKLHIPETIGYSLKNDDYIEVNEEDFDFDPIAKIAELEEYDKLDKLDQQEKNYLDSLRYSIELNPATQPKYFQEARGVRQYNDLGHHRDKRFFYGDNLIHDKHEYALRMNTMIRTFQKFAAANGIISWLSHGTLYGYLYNGVTFPWDDDFDLQMPIKHLNLLAQHFNQSLILEDPREGNGRYLVDVSSSITIRTRGNGNNNIDARFIDIDTGMYIDLTGLSVSMAPLKGEWKDRIDKIINEKEMKLYANPENNTSIEVLEKMHKFEMTPLQMYDYSISRKNEFTRKELLEINNGKDTDIREAEHAKWRPQKLNALDRLALNRKLKVYNCRNNHFILLSDLSPLRNSLFHGVPALVPKMHVAILKVEYSLPKQYGYLTYKDNTYVPEFRLWFKENQLKKYANINKWYAKLKSIGNKITESSIRKLTNITTTDIKVMYANMVRMHDADLLSIQYNGFNCTSYRIKELGIIYDQSLTLVWKQKFLHELRKHVAPKITSPGKDAFLFGYERELWKGITKNMPPATVKFVENSVHLDIYKDLINWSDQVSSEKLPMFNVTVENPDSILQYHYNNTGPINLNMNTIGHNYFGGQGVSWTQRQDVRLFNSDISLGTLSNYNLIDSTVKT